MTTTEPRTSARADVSSEADPVKRAHHACPNWLNLSALVSDDEIREVDALAKELAPILEKAMELSPRIERVMGLEKRIHGGDGDANVGELFNDIVGVDVVDNLACLAGFLLQAENTGLTPEGARGYSDNCEELVPGIIEHVETILRGSGE